MLHPCSAMILFLFFLSGCPFFPGCEIHLALQEKATIWSLLELITTSSHSSLTNWRLGEEGLQIGTCIKERPMFVWSTRCWHSHFACMVHDLLFWRANLSSLPFQLWQFAKLTKNKVEYGDLSCSIWFNGHSSYQIMWELLMQATAYYDGY